MRCPGHRDCAKMETQHLTLRPTYDHHSVFPEEVPGAGDVAQLAEHLPSVDKALGPVPGTT